MTRGYKEADASYIRTLSETLIEITNYGSTRGDSVSTFVINQTNLAQINH